MLESDEKSCLLDFSHNSNLIEFEIDFGSKRQHGSDQQQWRGISPSNGLQADYCQNASNGNSTPNCWNLGRSIHKDWTAKSTERVQDQTCPLHFHCRFELRRKSALGIGPFGSQPKESILFHRRPPSTSLCFLSNSIGFQGPSLTVAHGHCRRRKCRLGK